MTGRDHETRWSGRKDGGRRRNRHRLPRDPLPRAGDGFHPPRRHPGGFENRAGLGSSFRDDERAGDAGVEGGELEAVLFGEGEEVGVGGILWVLAPSGKGAAGG